MSSQFRKRFADAAVEAALSKAAPVAAKLPEPKQVKPEPVKPVAPKPEPVKPEPVKPEPEQPKLLTLEEVLAVVNSDTVTDEEYAAYMAKLSETQPDLHAQVVATMSDLSVTAPQSEGMPTAVASGDVAGDKGDVQISDPIVAANKKPKAKGK